MIDQKSKDIILKIVTQEISKDEISSILPDYYGDNNLMKMYYKVLDLKDSEALQYLNMLPKDNVLNFKEIEKKLLSEEWHTTHEDSTMQRDGKRGRSNLVLESLNLVGIYATFRVCGK